MKPERLAEIEKTFRDTGRVGEPAIDELLEEIESLQREQAEVVDMIDDILYDPAWKPVTHGGKPIRGNDLYLTDHPIQYDHLPALRDWFVRHACKATEKGCFGATDSESGNPVPLKESEVSDET